MKFYAAEALINAPIETVWSIITDGSSYTSWDSGITKLEGTIANGSKIKVFAAIAGNRAFPVRVMLDPVTHTMIWSGGMPFGLFRGVRTFTVTPHGTSTRLSMREVYTGPLVGLIWKSIPDLQPTFDKYVNGAKHRAETQTQHDGS